MTVPFAVVPPLLWRPDYPSSHLMVVAVEAPVAGDQIQVALVAVAAVAWEVAVLVEAGLDPARGLAAGLENSRDATAGFAGLMQLYDPVPISVSDRPGAAVVVQLAGSLLDNMPYPVSQ